MIRKKRRKAPRTPQQKYPCTDTFEWYNANPKGRITGDCRIRAICTACDVPYNQVVMDLAEIQCETGYDQCANQGLNILLERYGWHKQKQPRKTDNTKYTGEEFVKIFDGTCVANIGGHHMVCIKDHKVWDIWNSTGGCIGNYWTKEGE